MGDLVHGSVEHLLVRFRGVPEATYLPHELQGGGLDLLVRDPLIVDPQGLDAPTHVTPPSSGSLWLL